MHNMVIKKIFLFSLYVSFFLTYKVKAQIIVNEVSASDVSTIFDEDGDSSDWIGEFRLHSLTLIFRL